MVIFLGTLFIVICLLLIVVVLLQKGRGGGLGAAFGGAGASAFGTRTGDVFTWVTIVLTSLFLVMAAVTTIVLRPEKASVAPVQFLPADPIIAGPVGVTMFCDTADAEIHYTLNDSPVDRQSAVYRKVPVEVRPGVVLRARAFRSGYRDGPEVRVVYRTGAETAPAAEDAAAMMPATAPATAAP